MNKEERAAYKKKYYEKNREKIAAYYEKNRERKAAHDKSIAKKILKGWAVITIDNKDYAIYE